MKSWRFISYNNGKPECITFDLDQTHFQAVVRTHTYTYGSTHTCNTTLYVLLSAGSAGLYTSTVVETSDLLETLWWVTGFEHCCDLCCDICVCLCKWVFTDLLVTIQKDLYSYYYLDWWLVCTQTHNMHAPAHSLSLTHMRARTHTAQHTRMHEF